MELRYKEFGNLKGPLMMFLHGGGVSGWMWGQQVSYFSEFHCVIVDLPEHGSNMDSKPFSIKIAAELVKSLITERSSGKEVIVIEFSLGSQVLIELLSHHSRFVDIAVINSASVKPIPILKYTISPLVRLSFPLIKNRTFAKMQAKTLYIDEKSLNVTTRKAYHSLPNQWFVF